MFLRVHLWFHDRVPGAHLDTVLVFSLSSPEGGEGWGEEVNGFPGSKPLSPTLSPLGRGEGVENIVKMHPGSG